MKKYFILSTGAVIFLGIMWYARGTVEPTFWRVSGRGANPTQSLKAALVGEPDGGEERIITEDTESRNLAFVFQEPIDGFFERITKKPFGMFITPETSPVQPDRFYGYHTGVDVEYGDVSRDVPVRAIADGRVIISTFASGYGGVLVIRHTTQNQEFLALYGHLDPASLMPRGLDVKQGDVVGVLGDGETRETDGARKHLHFAILKGDKIDLHGYVKTSDELHEWVNPLDLF